MQKLIKYILLVTIFSLSSLSVTFAGGTFNKCINEPTTLVWSSSNATLCSGSITPGSHFSCAFGASLVGSQSIIPAGNCTVNYSCTGPGGSSIVDTATLIVDTTRIWDGSSCVFPTGSMTMSSNSCSIALGASSCTVNTTWSTTNPIGTSQITSNTTNTGAAAPGTVVYTGNAGGPSPVTISGSPTGSRNFYLYNNGTLLDTETINVTGCTTGLWDTISGTCRDPQVVSASIIGQYYPPGTLSLTCNGSDTYSVLLNGNPFIPTTPYTGPVTINNISVSGNYTIQCKYGSAVNQTSRPYDSAPPTAIISLSVSPTTLTKDGDVTVKWDTKYPTNACTLTAKVVCANNSCTAAQTAAQNALNAILTSTTTDFNDKATSRLLQTAIKTVAPGHKDTDVPLIALDWKALGKKTIRILYTTDLTYACSPTNKETKRIQITRSELQ